MPIVIQTDLGVLVRDEVGRRRERHVAADVIAVGVLLISKVTGFGVSSLLLARIGLPQPGFLASTTATPLAMISTAVLPPPPRNT